MKQFSIRIIFLIFLIPAFCIQGTAQDTLGKVRYSTEYRFYDGIYISFDQVIQNQPISRSRIISDINPSEIDYYSQLLRNEIITYVDLLGEQKQVPVKALWGYCNEGVLHIHWNNSFSRIPVVGNIAHFVSMVTVVHDPYMDPFYMSSPAMMPRSYETTDLQQYILDFKTGSVMVFNLESMEIVLSRDQKLYEEFLDIKKRKRKKLLFVYLRKYNERNPLYLPEN
ncbi:MAG: hypothetical protein C0594_06725 [Marinilabiliales bacterium]|nr:MAG: hypothetical protein C0594_06725 [Marinilabiliales bacterium]